MFWHYSEWFTSICYILVNICYFKWGVLFLGEMILTNFFIIFRSIMIAIKYGYYSKEELRFLREPHDIETIFEYHKTHNMISSWYNIELSTIYNEIDSSIHRVGDITEETLIYFRKKEQLSGYVRLLSSFINFCCCIIIVAVKGQGCSWWIWCCGGVSSVLLFIYILPL